MAEMMVNNLTVDLLQDQAAITLMKQGNPSGSGQPTGFTLLNINVPIDGQGDQPESRLKKTAIEGAKKALHEAIRTLEAYPI